MTHPIFKRLFDALAFANVGTLSEFHRELERREPLPAKAAAPRRAACDGAPARRDNVVSLRRGDGSHALHNPLLPKARLKP